MLQTNSMGFVASKPTEYPGKLIAVEGLDGSGKSTQIYLVKRWLELSGARVFFTEWNSSSLVKPSTAKGKMSRLLTPTTFSLIHATDFADRYERQIFPLLTAFARDVVRGVNREWVEQLYNFAVKPDVTLFFRAPLEVSLGRILDGRPELKFHEAGMDMGWSADPYESFRIFQGRILEQYELLAPRYGFTVVDATREIHDQQAEVRRIIQRRLSLADFIKKKSRS
jgi:dTMP kinase